MDIPEADPESSISNELRRHEATIREIQDSIDSVKLLQIEDAEDRLKATIAKQTALKNMGPLLKDLEDMRNRNKVNLDDVKGNKSLSPLENGTLQV